MVLMTFLMAGQLCAGLHRHLLTALSPHLLILVPAIIVIAIITIAVVIITFIIIVINRLFLIITIFVKVSIMLDQ